MYEVAEGVFDNPRWQREAITAGLNWRIDPAFIAKAQYSHRTVGLDTANTEDTISLGFGLMYGE